MAAHYSGPPDSPAVSFMDACNPRGPLVVAVAKLFPRQDCSRFDALGRIMSGTLRPGDRVKVGEGRGMCVKGQVGEACVLGCRWRDGNALGRVVSGMLRPWDRVKVGEACVMRCSRGAYCYALPRTRRSAACPCPERIKLDTKHDHASQW